MSDAPHAIRVFVSSTFRDMVAERDELATLVWPALRALCEDRAATFTDVDLRWGITREQAERGEVLPICLAEIDASRPYFVGILGERYGWVPEEIPADLVTQMPWLAEHRTRSVTELEIVHGVLNDPAMAGRAFFYFRDPGYSETMPEERRADFASENPEGAAKLRVLKDRIRALGLLRADGFRTPAELAKCVAADLAAAIDETFPVGEMPDPLQRARLAHEAYASSRGGVYIGREAYFDALDANVAGDGPPLVVTGESGGGKSALLANWARRHRDEHPDVPLVEHYTGAGVDATDWAAMCRRIMGEMAAATGVEVKLPESPNELRTAFREALDSLAKAGPVVLVIDGLNQLEQRDAALDLAWLPPAVPPAIRLVVATLPGRSLDEARRRGWSELEVEPLSPPERKALISTYLAGFAKCIDAPLAARIAAAPQAANPLYMRVLLDELRVVGGFEDLEVTVARYLKAVDPAALYALVLARWERDYDRIRPHLTRDAMSALWAARRGLSESELLLVLGRGGTPLPRAAFSPLYLAARPALVSRSGLLGFAHDFLRLAVEERYLPGDEDQRAAHGALAGYFATLDRRAPRVLDEYPWQLMGMAAWPELAGLLTDLGTLDALISDEPYDARVYWVALEDAGISAVDSYGGLLDSMEPDLQLGVGELLRNLGHTLAAEEALDPLDDVARKAGDLVAWIEALDAQAKVLEDRGDLMGAMKKLNQLALLYRLTFDRENLQFCLSRQANLLYAYGFMRKAMKRAKRTERVCRKRGYYAGLWLSLNVQAHILSDQGDAEGALALLTETERISRERGDLDGLASALSNQAVTRSSRGDHEGVPAPGQDLERVALESGDRDSLAHSLGARAAALSTRGDLDGALALLREQASMYRKFDAGDGLASSLGTQASILCKRGDLDDALQLWQEQERIYREIVDRPGHHVAQTRGRDNWRRLAVCLGNQSLVLRATGDLDGALSDLQEQEEILRRLYGAAKRMDRFHFGGASMLDEGNRLAGSLGDQAECLLDASRPAEALPLIEESVELARSLESPDMEVRLELREKIRRQMENEKEA